MKAFIAYVRRRRQGYSHWFAWQVSGMYKWEVPLTLLGVLFLYLLTGTLS